MEIDRTAHEAATARACGALDDGRGLTLSLPLEGLSEEAVGRLRKLVENKAGLIKKALGADRLDIEVDEDEGQILFPWWDDLPGPEEVQAYASFVAALCKRAKEAGRVNATARGADSEKYAFRAFLLRLGYIGPGSKAQRKILLRRLSGSAAFPCQEKADAFNAAQKAKRDAARAAAGAGLTQEA